MPEPRIHPVPYTRGMVWAPYLYKGHTTYHVPRYLYSHTMIPETTIQLIKETATDNIVEVIADFVKLKKRGGQFVGLSPFSNERTPSFYVKPNKGIYKCFSSGNGGDVISFLQKTQTWEFTDAIKYLAKRFNIDLENNNFVFTPKIKEAEPVKQPNFIHPNEMLNSKAGIEETTLYQFLLTKFTIEQVDTVFNKYHIGQNLGWIIFWQIDVNTYIRSGKYIKYKLDGHRDKEQRTTWHHSATKEYKPVYPDFNLVQCFFGEHLILDDIRKPIAIVESEKTALIASILMPKYIWLACGSKNGLNDLKCAVLSNRNVTLFPDVGCYAEWLEQAKYFNFNCSNMIENIATENDKGLDIADFLLR